MNAVNICVHLCGYVSAGTHQVQKKILDALGLELQAAVTFGPLHRVIAQAPVGNVFFSHIKKLIAWWLPS